MRIVIEGTDFGKLADYIARAKMADKITDELPVDAREIARDMQRAIINVNMTTQVRSGTAVGLRGSGGGGLRAAIAAAVKVRTTGTGALIEVDNASLGSRSNLPALIDGRGRWRHPVLGNRRVWVSQYAAPVGWFTQTANRAGVRIVYKAEGRADHYFNVLAAQIG